MGGGDDEGHGGGKKWMAISPFFDASGNKISVLLSASVERFFVSGMRDFLFYKVVKLIGGRSVISHTGDTVPLDVCG